MAEERGPNLFAKGTPEAKIGDVWVSYPTGTVFEVPGKSGFEVRAKEPAAYLCEFL